MQAPNALRSLAHSIRGKATKLSSNQAENLRFASQGGYNISLQKVAIFKQNLRGFLRCKKNFAKPLVSKLPDALAKIYALNSWQSHEAEFESSRFRNKKEHQTMLLFVGAESEIRTQEPCYRLHDFQSCALDQLGEFCILRSNSVQPLSSITYIL